MLLVIFLLMAFFLLAVSVLTIVCALRLDNAEKAVTRTMAESYFCIGVVFGIVSVILLIGSGSWSLIHYVNRCHEMARMEAFYTTQESYLVTYEETKALLSNIDEMPEAWISGSIEKIQITEQISDRIKEYRDEVLVYNRGIETLKMYKNNILFSWFTPSLPEHLEPISMK